MIPTMLDALLERHQIIAAIIVDAGTKTTIGERGSLDSDDIVRVLFDDLTSEELDEYLREQLLPRMSQQGRVCGVICKPTPTTTVGLYYHDERDVVSRYHFSKKLDDELHSLWNSTAP